MYFEMSLVFCISQYFSAKELDLKGQEDLAGFLSQHNHNKIG